VERIDKLAEWLITEKITIFSALAIFRQFSTILTESHKFPDIRLVNYGGDTVYKKDVDLYKKHFSQESILVVGLGTTEAGRVTQYFIDKETDLIGDIVPVGYPIQDMEILLLDDSGKKLGVDRTGEIAFKSRYLSPGYWRMPELSKAKFLCDPDGGDKRIYLVGDVGRLLPDGCLLHLGRKDFQIKVRGYRVEIAEVEKALRDLENIKESVVVDGEDSIGEKRLIAYLVCNTQPAPSVSRLRSALSQNLPFYMIPATFVILDALPLNPNGTVERKSLPEPDHSRPELNNPFIPARTSIEQTLTEIWSEVLNIYSVGIHDNFLDLGGNSLLMIRIISSVINTFQVKLSLKSLFTTPTIAEMGVLIGENIAKKVDRETLDQILTELDKLSDEEAKTAIMQYEKSRGKIKIV
jgi:acyl carrier protein